MRELFFYLVAPLDLLEKPSFLFHIGEGCIVCTGQSKDFKTYRNLDEIKLRLVAAQVENYIIICK